MPSGLTAPIVDGTATFASFLWACAENYHGCLPDRKYAEARITEVKRQIAEAENLVRELANRDEAAWKKAYGEYIDEVRRENIQVDLRRKKQDTELSRLSAMREQVVNWVLPDERFERFRCFVLRKIDETIACDTFDIPYLSALAFVDFKAQEPAYAFDEQRFLEKRLTGAIVPLNNVEWVEALEKQFPRGGSR